MDALTTNLESVFSKQYSFALLLNFLVQKYFVDTNCILQLGNDSTRIISVEKPYYIWIRDNYYKFGYNDTLHYEDFRCQYIIIFNPTEKSLSKVALGQFFSYGKNFKIIMVVDENPGIYNPFVNLFYGDRGYLYCFQTLYQTLFIKICEDRFELYEFPNFLYPGFDNKSKSIFEHTTHLGDWNIKSNTFVGSTPICFADKIKQSPGFIFTELGDTPFPIYIFKFAENYNFVRDRWPSYYEGKNFLHDHRVEPIIRTLSPYAIYTVLLVNKPRIVHHWFAPVSMIDLKLWLNIIMAYVLGGIYFHILSKRQRAPNALVIFSIPILQPMPFQVTGKFPKFVQMLLAILATLFSAIYASAIVTRLITPTFEGKIASVKDLLKMDCRIASFEILTLFQPVTETDHELLKRTQKFFLSADTIDYSDMYPDRVIYSTTISDMTKLPSEIPPETKEVLHEFLVTNPLMENLRTVQFLVPKFNEFMVRSLDVGLCQFWDLEMILNYNDLMEAYEYLDNIPPPLKPTVLTVDHIKGVLVLWAICIAVSIVAFLSEIIFWGRYKYYFL